VQPNFLGFISGYVVTTEMFVAESYEIVHSLNKMGEVFVIRYHRWLFLKPKYRLLMFKPPVKSTKGR